MPPWPLKLERGCIPLRLPLAGCIGLGQGQTQLPWGVPMTFAARAVGPWDAPNARGRCRTKGRGCTPSHGSPGAFGGQLPNYHMGHVACSYTLLMKYLNHDEIVHLRFADREGVASR